MRISLKHFSLASVFLFAFLVTSLEVHANTYSEVDIIIHKQFFTTTPKEVVRDGQVDESMEGTPQANDQFIVYDVTKEYQQQQKEKEFTRKAFLKAWGQLDSKTIADQNLPVIQEVVTNDKGQAHVKVPVDQQAAYLFVEKTSSQQTEPTAPVVVLLPLYQTNTDKELQEVHIYLKNTQPVFEIKEPPEEFPNTNGQENISPNVSEPQTDSPWYRLPNTGSTTTKISLIGALLLLSISSHMYLKHKKNKQKQ